MAPDAATRHCRLYLITPPRFEAAAFAGELAAALDAGDVACVQLRLPRADDDDIRAAARALMAVCHARDVAFLLENRVDLAAELGADGVHLADSGAVAMARSRLGAGTIVGASCGGSRHAAMDAAEAGADYVSFGAVFPSPTIPQAAVVGVETIAWWSGLMEIPGVAVGGITPENCASPVAAGADFLAVCAAVWSAAKGPSAAVAAFISAIDRAVESPGSS
ncbi:MAG: thiamine phosphate synthase [Alphaproteobacteria bacterium]